MLVVAVNVFALPASADWVKEADGKSYYYFNGKKLTGWRKIDENYYFFNVDGVLIRTETEAEFKPFLDFEPMGDTFSKYLGYDNFAGNFVNKGKYYIMVTDEEDAISKALKKFPDFYSRPVTFILAEYSQNQLESTRQAFYAANFKASSWTDVKENRMYISVTKITSDLINFKQSLPYGDCIVFQQAPSETVLD